MLNGVVAALLIANIAVQVVLYQKVAYIADTMASVGNAAQTAKTVVAGGIIDRTILVKDAAMKAKESVMNFFSRKKIQESFIYLM
jgi:hypothetical protein